MSKEELVEIANDDTPQGVRVPNSWAGLLSWLTIRFGVSIIFAAIFGIMTRQVYNDLRADQHRLLAAYLEATVASNRNAEAIDNLGDEIRRQNEIDKQQNDLLQKQTEAIERLQRNNP